MDNLRDSEYLDEHEIQLEDLDVPAKGFRLFLYGLGEKLNPATRFRTRWVALLGSIALLFILFLPSSALLNAPVYTSYPTSTASQQNSGCQEITVNSKDSNWHIPPSIPTPPDSVTLHICNAGTVHFKVVSTHTSPGVSNSKVTPQK